LEQIGPAAAEAMPALITTLGDVDQNVRERTAESLGQIQSASPAAKCD
jgi:HEAT repeat protein